MKSHPRYAEGKAGDSDSAYQLVKDCLSLEVIDSIQAIFAAHRLVIASAHSIERDGVNAIPEVLADFLGIHLGWQVDSSIVQSNIVAHTGADGFSRLARQARFEGNVESGKAYFLVDDFIGQGGTLANLRSFIISEGADVIGASVLTGKPFSANLALSAETLKLLLQNMEPNSKSGGVQLSTSAMSALQSLKRVISSTPRPLTASEVELLRRSKDEVAKRVKLLHSLSLKVARCLTQQWRRLVAVLDTSYSRSAR